MEAGDGAAVAGEGLDDGLGGEVPHHDGAGGRGQGAAPHGEAVDRRVEAGQGEHLGLRLCRGHPQPRHGPRLAADVEAVVAAPGEAQHAAAHLPAGHQPRLGAGVHVHVSWAGNGAGSRRVTCRVSPASVPSAIRSWSQPPLSLAGQSRHEGAAERWEDVEN